MQGPVFIYLTPGILAASCRRSIFTLAMSMLAYAGKVCHITELSDLLWCFTFCNVSSAVASVALVEK
jgi:protein EFR3